MDEIFALLLVMLSVICIICFALKLTKLAIGLIVVFTISTTCFTIFWGNGTNYVNFVAQYLPEGKAYALQDWYSAYKQADMQDPIIDADKILNDIEALPDQMALGITNVFNKSIS